MVSTPAERVCDQCRQRKPYEAFDWVMDRSEAMRRSLGRKTTCHDCTAAHPRGFRRHPIKQTLGGTHE